MTAAFTRVLVPIDFRDHHSENLDAVDAGDLEILEVGERKVELTRASREALLLACQNAGEDTTIHLVHATPSYDQSRIYRGKSGAGILGSLDDLHREAAESAESVLRAAADRHCADARVEVSAKAGHALHVILDLARSWAASIIVMPTSSHGAVARFFLGSTADRVIRDSPCPVLVVPGGPRPELTP